MLDICCWLLLMSIIYVDGQEHSNRILPDDAYLTTPQLISKYGYKPETHEVETHNGYIVTLFRIKPGKKCKNVQESSNNNPPVLVMHGLVSCSTDFVLLGPKRALGYLLSDKCYDVWLGNSRGNSYSKKHKNLTIDAKEYWDFSWHEQGIEDLPVVIDYVLQVTKYKALSYIGHSQGCTQFFVYSSLKTEDQGKINTVICLAPAIFLGQMKSVLRFLIPYTSAFVELSKELNSYELLGNSDIIRALAKTLCSYENTRSFCSLIFFILCGSNQPLFNYSLLPTLLHHTPAGSSIKQVLHFTQLVTSGQFKHFDYGPKENMKRYNRRKPPEYPIEKIKTPMYIFYGENDLITTPNDMLKLSQKLTNQTTTLIKVKYKYFNHVDFTYANNVENYVYKSVLDILGKENYKRRKNG